MKTEVLEVPRPPPSAAGEMPIWHTNIELPTTRKSYAPIPGSTKPQPQEPVERTVQFEEVLDFQGSPQKIASRRKRGSQNDSISLFSTIAHIPQSRSFCSDEDGVLDSLSDYSIG